MSVRQEYDRAETDTSNALRGKGMLELARHNAEHIYNATYTINLSSVP